MREYVRQEKKQEGWLGGYIVAQVRDVGGSVRMAGALLQVATQNMPPAFLCM